MVFHNISNVDRKKQIGAISEASLIPIPMWVIFFTVVLEAWMENGKRFIYAATKMYTVNMVLSDWLLLQRNTEMFQNFRMRIYLATSEICGGCGVIAYPS